MSDKTEKAAGAFNEQQSDITAAFEGFLQDRVLPQYRDIIDRFVEQATVEEPEMRLRMRGGTARYYSVPVFKLARDIVAISPTKSGVTFSFTAGAAFTDPFDLLGGDGKRPRTIRVSDETEYLADAMAHYLRQAAILDRNAIRTKQQTGIDGSTRDA
ncbi:DUF1801 domain-containing protein [Notoacmeibacter marinus]|uniref:DUF1801 domain-containing protein n=1 Tax=Notoacmeibacter marinus TaxID=1876515 RepID=UPI000DF1CCDA|nr:DUF1801 domain-containing protein [Notoacmeibacter marinus]